MKRSPAPFAVRYWHPGKRKYQHREFHGPESQAFLEAARYYASRKGLDEIQPALLNHLGHVWTGKRNAQGAAIWTTEAAWAEAA